MSDLICRKRRSFFEELFDAGPLGFSTAIYVRC